MKDPNRLIDSGATEVERCLLRAAIAEEPSPSAARRAAAALGVSGVVGLATNTAAASTASVVLGKLIWLGAASGAAAIGWIGYQSLTSQAEPTPTPQAAILGPTPSKDSARSDTPDSVEQQPEPPPASTAQPAPRQPRAARPKPAGPPQPSKPTSTLPSNNIAAEISHLDSVRAALSRGESQQALERLDTYTRKHPRALLGQEAVLLRIEALVQAGHRGAASALARRFLASEPQSPHRKRIESIVGPVGSTSQ